MKQAKRWGPMVAAAIMLLFMGLLLWHNRATAVAVGPAIPPSPEEDPEIVFSAPGVTEPRSRTVEVYSETSGTLKTVHVTAGDRVRKGQILAEVNDDIQKASVDLSKAALQRAESELARLRNGDRPEERAILKARLSESEIALRAAEFDWQRTQKMTSQNAVSDKEVADARTSLELAQSRREEAAKRWELSNAGARSEDLARAEAAIREAQAQINAAESVFERTRIRSPLDGIVIYRFREPGEAVFTDHPTPILTVGDRSTLHVRVDVDEIDIAGIRLGQQVYATALAYGDKRFPGRVIHIEPTLGRKNFRTRQPTERLDTKVQEVVVALDKADEVPLELQMIAWFLRPDQEPSTESQ